MPDRRNARPVSTPIAAPTRPLDLGPARPVLPRFTRLPLAKTGQAMPGFTPLQRTPSPAPLIMTFSISRSLPISHAA